MADKSEKKILDLGGGRKFFARGESSGFTLIELLVSIFIIALISSVFMVDYHSTNKRSELKVTVQKLASNIRLAQNYSLGSKTYNGVTTPSGGWGVNFSLARRASYIIFADINANRAYDAGEAIETKVLPAGMALSATVGIMNMVPQVDIIFFPPDPVTYINGLDNFSARVELKENINNSTAAVTVNSFGLIDVE